MVGGLVGQHYLGLVGRVIKVFEPDDTAESVHVAEYLVEIPRIGQRAFPEFLLAPAVSEKSPLVDPRLCF